MSDYESVLADIPDDWTTATIEGLGSVVSGGTPSREIASYWGGSIPWVTPGEVTTLKEKTFRLTSESITEEGLRQSGANLLPAGSLLVTTRASLGYCAINSVPVTTNQGFKSIVFRQSSNPDFYYHWTRKVSPELKRRASGTTFLEISGSDFKQIKFPVPPSAEQQTIAQILDTLDTQIQKTEALIAKLEKIKEGLLHDLLTRGIDENGQLRPSPEQAPELYKDSALGLIPKQWLIGPIEHALEKIIDYRGKTPTKTEHGIPLITAKNVRMGFIAPEPREFIASSSYDNWMTRGIPSKTDVVFTTEAPLGNVAQVGTDEKVAFAQRVIILQPKSHLRPELLKLLLMSSDFQGRAMRAASGSTALGIKQSVFKKLFIAHPASMAEQDAMTKILRDLDERRASEFRCLTKLTEMKMGLMDDLLTGRVRITPPTEGCSMTTFDSTKRSLPELLKDITNGKIQLPDFQRGWVWDDEHVKSLLVSIARSFPVGAVMLMETGGEVQFQVRPVEGISASEVTDDPEQLILDGQQRLTSLTQAIALTTPVDTRTAKGKDILRHYYFDIAMALEGDDRLDEAVKAVDKDRQIRSNFGRDVELDLSTRELECQQLHFPCDKILDDSQWLQDLFQYNPEGMEQFLKFKQKIIGAFVAYQIPIIELKKETSKEAVCLVFEKVNTGGVQLSVFELMTASYAAEGYNLRDDWFGSDIRNVASRQDRFAKQELLKGVESTDFLQAITLLHTRQRKYQDIADGKQGKQVRPVSAKRASVLELPLTAYQKWADEVEAGFIEASKFLAGECFFSRKELPYGTQLVPLAATMTLLGERWREPKVHQKLARWFWSGVLGELYGGAVETRIAVDLEELMDWFEDDSATPRTVTDASFDPERLESLRSRLSAAYKGINVLILREGASDFFWKGRIQQLDTQEVALDIHHIFPRAWCEANSIPPKVYDSIINKTPISYKANRMIGGDAPSTYLAKLQSHEQVQLENDEMDVILNGHFIPTEQLRTDDFPGFFEARKRLLMGLIEKAMGKKALSEGA